MVAISRASGTLTFPANFILIAAMTPCPCGYYGDPTRECACSAAMIARHRERVSAPVLDRIDIHVEVPRVEYGKLSDTRKGEPSAALRARVEEARERQCRRLQGLPILANGEMGPAEVHRSALASMRSLYSALNWRPFACGMTSGLGTGPVPVPSPGVLLVSSGDMLFLLSPVPDTPISGAESSHSCLQRVSCQAADGPSVWASLDDRSASTGTTVRSPLCSCLLAHPG